MANQDRASRGDNILKEETAMDLITRRRLLSLLGIGGGIYVSESLGARRLLAQTKTRLSILTGGTGGVYYPLGGGMAALISKYLPGVEATAEVTTASVDNMKLLQADKVAVAFTQPDIAWDAYQGQLKGFSEKIGVRSLAALY